MVLLENVMIEMLPVTRVAEGRRLKAYQDTGGVWTIGYGHTKGVKPGDSIFPHEAETLLLVDAAEALHDTLLILPELADMPSHKVAAITDFTFNLGAGRLRASTLATVIKTGRLDRVPTELRRWVYGTDMKTGAKVQLNGLIRRRDAECALWEKATHGSSTAASL
jgi:lysozyme